MTNDEESQLWFDDNGDVVERPLRFSQAFMAAIDAVRFIGNTQSTEVMQ